MPPPFTPHNAAIDAIVEGVFSEIISAHDKSDPRAYLAAMAKANDDMALVGSCADAFKAAIIAATGIAPSRSAATATAAPAPAPEPSVEASPPAVQDDASVLTDEDAEIVLGDEPTVYSAKGSHGTSKAFQLPDGRTVLMSGSAIANVKKNNLTGIYIEKHKEALSKCDLVDDVMVLSQDLHLTGFSAAASIAFGMMRKSDAWKDAAGLNPPTQRGLDDTARKALDAWIFQRYGRCVRKEKSKLESDGLHILLARSGATDEQGHTAFGILFDNLDWMQNSPRSGKLLLAVPRGVVELDASTVQAQVERMKDGSSRSFRILMTTSETSDLALVRIGKGGRQMSFGIHRFI